MKTGAKWQVFVPAELAYGKRQFGRIPPNSLLIFELELLSLNEDTPSKTLDPKTPAMNGTLESGRKENKPMFIFQIIFLVVGLGLTFLILTIIRAASRYGRCTHCRGAALTFVYVDKVKGRLCLPCAEKLLHVGGAY